MRELTDHKTNAANRELTVEAIDAPGAGGANHIYRIGGFHYPENVVGPSDALICFQNGTIPEVGANGLTQEILLAIVIDRLRAFQAGPFACPENADALVHTEEALAALKSRTTKRVARGVEGTHAV